MVWEDDMTWCEYLKLLPQNVTFSQSRVQFPKKLFINPYLFWMKYAEVSTSSLAWNSDPASVM